MPTASGEHDNRHHLRAGSNRGSVFIVARTFSLMSGRDVMVKSSVRGSTTGELYAVCNTDTKYRPSASCRCVTGAVEKLVALVQVSKRFPNFSKRVLQPRRAHVSVNSFGEQAYNEKYRRNSSYGMYVRTKTV